MKEGERERTNAREPGCKTQDPDGHQEREAQCSSPEKQLFRKTSQPVILFN